MNDAANEQQKSVKRKQLRRQWRTLFTGSQDEAESFHQNLAEKINIEKFPKSRGDKVSWSRRTCHFHCPYKGRNWTKKIGDNLENVDFSTISACPYETRLVYTDVVRVDWNNLEHHHREKETNASQEIR